MSATYVPSLLSELGGTISTAQLPADGSSLAITAADSSAARSLAARFSEVKNVRDFGAVGDGTTDDRAAIQAALDAASSAGGGRVSVPVGGYALGAAISVPANCTLAGAGTDATTFLVPTGSTFAAIDVDGASGVTLRDFTVRRPAGVPGGTSGTGYGLWIRGDSADVLVSGVAVGGPDLPMPEGTRGDGFVRGINITGGTGTVPGTCRRITLRDVTSNNSPSTFGICLDDVDGVTLDNCYARGNWLDGVKLRKQTRNVAIKGGAFTFNGRGKFFDPVNLNGDGLDGYAGGDTFSIEGTDFSDNANSGLQIKTGSLNKDTPEVYGYVRRMQLRGLRCCRNGGTGLDLTVSDFEDLTETLVSHVEVDGGLYDENGTNGIYCSARNVTINNPIVRKNGEHGIVTGSRALDVEINDVLAVANGTTSPGVWSGANINGNHISVNRGRWLGKDADVIGQESDLDAATAVSLYGVLVGSAANNIWVNWPTCRHHASHGVRALSSGGTIIINQFRGGAPSDDGHYGSVGSLYSRSYASTGDDGYEVLWAKTSGKPSDPGPTSSVSGNDSFTRLVVGAPVQSLPTATALLRGLILRLLGGDGVRDSFHICQRRADASYGWDTILTGAAGTDYLAPTGSGASLTALNATQLTSGTVPTARLGTGTASASTYPNGAGAWSVPLGMQTGTKSGMYYPAMGGSITTGLIANGTLSLSPLVFPRAVSVSELALEVTVAGTTGAVIRPCLYADDGSGFPGSLLMDSLGLDATATGVKTYTPAAPLALPAGIYWIGSVTQGAPTTVPTIRINGGPNSMVGYTTAAGTASNNTSYIATGVTGTLPTTWTASGSSTNAARVVAKLA